MITPDLFPPTRSQIRGLSLWRPWPHSMHGSAKPSGSDTFAYAPGPKQIENRGWHPPAALVGSCWLALQSGGHYDKDGEAFLQRQGWRFPGPHPKFAITGVGFLAAQFGICDAIRRKRIKRCLHCIASSPHSDDPFYMGGVGWLLTGRVPLIEPVQCKGFQGLRRLPEAIEEQVRAEYARSVSILGDQLAPGPRMVS